MKAFTSYNLSEEIQRALDALGYEQPTEVQREVIPPALQKRDITAKARTGSGKTGAYAIPICEVVDWEENRPQALVLTPTRELAAQVKEDFTNIGRFKRIKAAAVYGKQPFKHQATELKQKTHVVIGTPGRVLDHIEKGTLHLDKLHTLVIDEADEMLNMGFIDQVEAIITHLPNERTTMLFSATMPKDVEKLCHRYMKDPVDIQIETPETDEPHIEHGAIVVKDEEKLKLLKDFATVENPDSCIIFCRTKERVDTLVDQLDSEGWSCDKLHGGMYQDDRFEVMDDFRRGDFRYLIATDVAARGIDIEKISLVINYDVPLEKEAYVHRTGRTGRAGEKGKAITFVTPYEDKFLKEIEEFVSFTIPEIAWPSKEDVEKKEPAFMEKMIAEPELKKDKGASLNKDITKLYFNGGKKKKIRAVDFVGTIAKIEGVSADDIGIITIEENVSYVEILNGKGPLVLKTMKNTTIKGKQLKVYIAKK
ncbi:DEAD/DEAH box helicase [Chungangia koreensis]|uniref:ATP-dependent RNA helicase DbpA n=1 Tax=Chungangia koreensis TaxID=752657 RepID=A0ABV8XBM5_9LACT